ncbi:MAG: DUF4127 family protein [Vampirovibrionales bacterium]|nr:DUF4127 family protein [Vampirovibrionales bacterium]
MGIPVVVLIPLDARPVCLAWPKLLARMAGVELLTPPESILGHLKTPAKQDDLQTWVDSLSLAEAQVPFIVALDTLIYGGLIPSRMGIEPLTLLEERLVTWQPCLNQAHGFASVMRIAVYNNDAEEPGYWATYGKALSEFSIQIHRDGQADLALVASIPAEVRRHFLETRRRNMVIHRAFLDWAKGQTLESLVICQDDTGEYGLNRQEVDLLKSAVNGHNVSKKVSFQTGADEVAVSQLAKVLWKKFPPDSDQTPKVAPKISIVYSNPATANRVATFDGLAITTLVAHHVAACGGTIIDSLADADAVLWVHTPPNEVEIFGDYCEAPAPKATEEQIQSLRNTLALGKPTMVADVAAANGGSPDLVNALLAYDACPVNLIAYGAWNTPGNAMGSTVAMGLIHYWAFQNGSLVPELFRQALAIRLLDDGVYQSQVRSNFPTDRALNDDDAQKLQALMTPWAKTILAWAGLSRHAIRFSFPCQRRFEIEVNISPC